MLRTTREEEPLLDAVTAGKVAGLAERLQRERGERFTLREMETIGAEVGLEPAFIRQAVRELTPREAAAPVAVTVGRRRRSQGWRAKASAWWAAGWTLPLVGALLGEALGQRDNEIGIFFFLGWSLYIGIGVLLAHHAREEEEADAAGAARVAGGAPGGMSRAELLETLFALQHRLEGQKQRRAFLSVDVAGSSTMKQGADELAVEYSFSQFRSWVELVARAAGGQVHSAAGDGLMCVFDDDTLAVRAARELQLGLPHFNGTRNRLPAPFRIRCGISAGDVAIEPGAPLGNLHSAVIDRAAALQKRAAPGDIVVGEELAGSALAELGSLSQLSEPVLGSRAYSWSG